MKVTMQLTLADLVRTLRWQAMELIEEAAEKASRAQKQSPPPRDDKS
ncbi:hypothetical protein [Phyllobacterium sp. 22552]